MKFKKLSAILWKVESKDIAIYGTWEECQNIIYNYYSNKNLSL